MIFGHRCGSDRPVGPVTPSIATHFLSSDLFLTNSDRRTAPSVRTVVRVGNEAASWISAYRVEDRVNTH